MVSTKQIVSAAAMVEATAGLRLTATDPMLVEEQPRVAPEATTAFLEGLSCSKSPLCRKCSPLCGSKDKQDRMQIGGDYVGLIKDDTDKSKDPTQEQVGNEEENQVQEKEQKLKEWIEQLKAEVCLSDEELYNKFLTDKKLYNDQDIRDALFKRKNDIDAVWQNTIKPKNHGFTKITPAEKRVVLRYLEAAKWNRDRAYDQYWDVSYFTKETKQDETVARRYLKATNWDRALAVAKYKFQAMTIEDLDKIKYDAGPKDEKRIRDGVLVSKIASVLGNGPERCRDSELSNKISEYLPILAKIGNDLPEGEDKTLIETLTKALKHHMVAKPDTKMTKEQTEDRDTFKERMKKTQPQQQKKKSALKIRKTKSGDLTP